MENNQIPPTDQFSENRLKWLRHIRLSAEVVLLFLSVGFVWGFGGNDPRWEAAAAFGIFLLVALWGTSGILSRKLPIQIDLVTVCLAGLTLLAVVQLVPLPLQLVKLLSPGMAELHLTMRPELGERLSTEATAIPRPTWLAMTLDPYGTRIYIARLVALLMTYLVVRNWLASREALNRFAWACTVNGLVLAAFALGQFFSSEGRNTIYWSIPTIGSVYGPFICRNHYPDYAAICCGLGLGLLFQTRDRSSNEYLRGVAQMNLWERAQEILAAPGMLLSDPRTLLPAFALGLMAVSIPFSLSRGGFLAVVFALFATWLLARIGREKAIEAVNDERRSSARRWGIVFVVGISAGLMAWFGWGPIEKRFGGWNDGRQEDNRSPLWKTATRSLSGFWFSGSGAGSFRWVEPLARTNEDPSVYSEHAHNEYLEALIEGGPIRLAITLVLVVGVIAILARGYLSRRPRSVGPLLLGSVFAMAVAALHNGLDFAIHMPAVALLTVTLLGFVIPAAQDPDFAPVRKRVNKGKKRSSRSSAAKATEAEPTSSQRRPDVLEGLVLKGFVAFSVLLAFGIVLDTRNRAKSESLILQARALARGDDPNRHAITVAYYEARVRLRPGDPSAHLDLALAHFDAAKEWGPIIHGSVAGPLVTRSFGAERFPQAVVHEHIELGLRSLRTARDLCPSFPEVQGALGIYGRFFTHADLPIKYLDRSLKLLPSDGNTWAIAGTEAWRSGDEAGAIQHWKKALELSPLELTYVLRTINTRLSPAVIRDRILPDDPIVLLGAANSIYPDRVAQAAERRPFLEGAAAALGRPTLTDAQCVAIADACQQLNRPNDVVAAWRKAIELAPRKIEYRNRFARWLEAEERYEEVIEHLEWMLDQDPRNLELPDRILIARHGAKLQQEIGR